MNLKTMRKTINQIIKFLITGSITTSLNYIIFIVLFRLVGINYLISSAIGYLMGVYLSYIINRRWTFNINDNNLKITNFGLENKIEIVKYFSVYVFSLVGGLIILKVFVSILGIRAEISNIISIVFSTCSNFLGMKFFVFKK